MSRSLCRVYGAGRDNFPYCLKASLRAAGGGGRPRPPPHAICTAPPFIQRLSFGTKPKCLGPSSPQVGLRAITSRLRNIKRELHSVRTSIHT